MLYFRCPSCRDELANKVIVWEKEMVKISNNTKLSKDDKDKQQSDLLDKLFVENNCCRMRIITYPSRIDIVK